MSASRRFCRWVAWNIDGATIRRLPRSGLAFTRDPEYPAAHQVDDRVYAGNPLDRGHVARRADLLWGSQDEARRANVDSFLFTNITPQLDKFNQSGLWGQLEDAIFDDVEIDGLRVSLFGGPILKETDFPYRSILVPRSFWKLVAFVEAGVLRAKAYVLTQDDLESRLEALGLEPFKLFQTAIPALADMTGLDFGSLAGADTMPEAPEALGAAGVRRIDTRDEIVNLR